MKISAGILFWRLENKDLQVFLVHSSGEKSKNTAWSIPKGEVESKESLSETAIREVNEEISILVEESNLLYIGSAFYPNDKKKVHCFISQANFSENKIVLNWENDQGKFFTLNQAKKIIHPSQIQFLNDLAYLFNSEK